MRNYYEDYPTDWHCDECEPRAESRGDLLRGSELINSGTVCHDATRSIKSRTLSNETRRGSLNWEKKVVTGRTKFIPVNEAIKLSSGAPKTTSFKMVTRHSSPPLLQMGVNLLAKTSIKPQIIPMESSTYRGRAKYASGPSQEKPQRQGNVKISWRQQQSKELGGEYFVLLDCIPPFDILTFGLPYRNKKFLISRFISFQIFFFYWLKFETNC